MTLHCTFINNTYWIYLLLMKYAQYKALRVSIILNLLLFLILDLVQLGNTLYLITEMLLLH